MIYMDTSDNILAVLKKAGLTDSQAKGYLALIQHGSLSPAELAEKTDESRTNGYMICEKLESLGLATKKDGKKTVYAPTHPSALEALAEKRRKILVRNEQEVKQSMSPLIDLFYANNELPGTRTLQGLDGIREVYRDTLRAKQDIYLLRTTADATDLGVEYLDQYRCKRADAGIHTYALTPKTDIGVRHQESGEDEKMLFHRTFLPDSAYTAPVEIDVYGNKVALIAYGDTQMATIIDSPPVAEAMRQLLRLLQSSLTKQ
jgi:sugar-specific transcriptional regulator TrmB